MRASTPIWLLAMLLAGACAKLPPTHYYLLEAQPGHVSATEDRGPRIGVEPFEVVEPYDQRAIVYRPEEHTPEIGYYSYHQWAAPLPIMLQRAAVGALSSSSAGLWAEPAAPDAVYDARLTGRLLTLEEVDLEQGRQRVDLALDLRLADVEGRELWAGHRKGSAEVSAKAVVDIVDTMNELLASSLSDLGDEITAALQP